MPYSHLMASPALPQLRSLHAPAWSRPQPLASALPTPTCSAYRGQGSAPDPARNLSWLLRTQPSLWPQPQGCNLAKPALPTYAFHLVSGKETWPGFRQGDMAPVCHGCQPHHHAKRMEVVAPPASGRPAGSKTEAEAERELFRHRQAPVCQRETRALGCLAC